jgi:hypothetical protein
MGWPWENKALKVTMVDEKDISKNILIGPPRPPIDYEKVAEVATKCAVVIICTYFGASTAREVIVKSVATK